MYYGVFLCRYTAVKYCELLYARQQTFVTQKMCGRRCSAVCSLLKVSSSGPIGLYEFTSTPVIKHAISRRIHEKAQSK
jgi:hypothetical protein